MVATNPRKPLRLLAEQALSRAAGAPLLGGNTLELLIDAAAHFDAWLKAVRGARQRVLLENYIIRDDEIGRLFRDARSRNGLGLESWSSSLSIGSAVSVSRAVRSGLRCAPRVVRYECSIRLTGWESHLGWMRRDHRKLLVVDGTYGSLSGVCISAKMARQPGARHPAMARYWC